MKERINRLETVFLELCEKNDTTTQGITQGGGSENVQSTEEILSPEHLQQQYDSTTKWEAILEDVRDTWTTPLTLHHDMVSFCSS